VVHSRINEEVGMAHKVKSPENQLQFSQTTMGHYWLGKLSPSKLSGESEMLSKSYHRIFKKFYLMEFSTD